MKNKAVFITNWNNSTINKIYNDEVMQKLTDEFEFPAEIINKNNIEQFKDFTNECKYIFTTWGMLDLSEEDIAKYFSKCEVVFYGAGSVQYFARNYLNRGIRITSAWVANGIPVAEYAVSQMLLACKGYFRNVIDRIRSKSDWGNNNKILTTYYKGNYNTKIGILGAGTIGKRIINMLKVMNIKTEILVYDPYFTDEQAEKFGAKKASLEEIFSTCDVISNHVANLPSTERMLTKSHFSLMKDYSTFINSGRGQQIIESEMAEVFRNNRTLTALIDVSHPEPPAEEGENSELYKLDNIILTPHVAGVIGNELNRLGEFMYGEYKLYESEKKLNYEVTLEMLEYMA
jgi:phosphoglycerate dehydrogenase-like enzyme